MAVETSRNLTTITKPLRLDSYLTNIHTQVQMVPGFALVALNHFVAKAGWHSAGAV